MPLTYLWFSRCIALQISADDVHIKYFHWWRSPACLRRQAGGQCLGQIVSAINVHICCSIVPGHAGSYVPGRSVTHENQALTNWGELEGCHEGPELATPAPVEHACNRWTSLIWILTIHPQTNRFVMGCEDQGNRFDAQNLMTAMNFS